ncbi:MAG: hypothetical protein Q9184_004822 [Pyrenodesmia sp. 2 TL-2023]
MAISHWRQFFQEQDEVQSLDESETPIDAEIRNAIALSNDPAATLADLLASKLQQLHRNEAFIYCLLRIASQRQVNIISTTENAVEIQGIVDRYKIKRLRLLKNSDTLLQQSWGGWNILQLKQQYSKNLKEKLAQLCRLGVPKSQAIDKLKAQIETRRACNRPGISKTPDLLPSDVAAVIKAYQQAAKAEQQIATRSQDFPPDEDDNRSNGPADSMSQPDLQLDPEESRISGERGGRQAHVLGQSERGPAMHIEDREEEETEHKTRAPAGGPQEGRAEVREDDQGQADLLRCSMDSPEVMRGCDWAEELSLSPFPFATATPATRGRDSNNSQLESRKRRKTSDSILSSGDLDPATPPNCAVDLWGRSSRRNSPSLEPTVEGQTATSLLPPHMNAQASLYQCPPKNTLLAAVKSFDGDDWLTSTAIQVALGMLPSDNAKIFDPSYMEAANPESMLRKTSRSRWLDILSVFPSNHHGKHWTLMIYDPLDCEVEFYDSLEGTSYEMEAERAMQCCIDAAQNTQHGSVEWSFRRKDCPRQHNLSDCGVSVILCAMRRILGVPLPLSFDYQLWRLILHAVLSQGLPDVERRIRRVTTPPENASLVEKEHAPFPDSVLTLTRDFETMAHEHTLAKSQCSMTQDAMDTLDIILEKLQTEMDSATNRLNMYQKALDEHRAALDQYRKLETRHDAVVHAFEAAIEVEERGQQAQKSYAELLEPKRSSWQAGRVVCRTEQELQTQHERQVFLAMEKIVKQLDILHHFHVESAETAKQSFLECETRLQSR